MRKLLIVTLSKWLLISRWSKHCIKDQSKQIVYVDTVKIKVKAHITLNTMHVDTINTSVYGFYTTLYTEH